MTRPISAADEDPDLHARLWGDYRQFLESQHPYMGRNQAAALEQQTREGFLTALLWRPEPGSRVGLARVLRANGAFRVIGIWYEPSTADCLNAMLEDLERSDSNRLESVTDILPGLDAHSQARLFRARGFWHRAKVLLHRPAHAPRPPASHRPEIRPIRKTDLPQLVGVYARAYSKRPGEFWTWGSPYPWREAEDDVLGHLTASGEWSEQFRPGFSFVWDSDGRVLGGVLTRVERTDIPYVEDLIVEPEFHRRGIGRALMEHAIDAVQAGGSRPFELAAIYAGAPYRLYRSLGFEDVEPPEGQLDGNWIRGSQPY
jgi:GNAT superfamily N-acetyltransferase